MALPFDESPQPISDEFEEVLTKNNSRLDPAEIDITNFPGSSHLLDVAFDQPATAAPTTEYTIETHANPELVRPNEASEFSGDNNNLSD